ncbi:unnamed protein product, partial [Strongylus vulgaris]
MLKVCWNGDRSQPPMPIHLYKATLEIKCHDNEFLLSCDAIVNQIETALIGELKEASLQATEKLQKLCSKKPLNITSGDFSKRANISQECCPEEKPLENECYIDNEKPGQSLSWKIPLMERITDILGILDTAANAGENVAQALTMLMVIRQCIKKGDKDSYDDVSAKMKKLDKMVAELEKASLRRLQEIDQPSSSRSNNSVAQTPPASAGRKRGRPRSMKTRDSEEYAQKRKSMPAVVNAESNIVPDNADDDLVSRVKRGQRNRRPARTFTPAWEISSPSPPPKTKAATKAVSEQE